MNIHSFPPQQSAQNNIPHYGLSLYIIHTFAIFNSYIHFYSFPFIFGIIDFVINIFGLKKEMFPYGSTKLFGQSILNTLQPLRDHHADLQREQAAIQFLINLFLPKTCHHQILSLVLFLQWNIIVAPSCSYLPIVNFYQG